MLGTKIKIAVLVSGGGTNLKALLDAQDKGIIKSGNIALVISSNPDAYALTRAKEKSIEAFSIDRAACLNQKDFEKKIISVLKEKDIEFIVLAGFMCILSADFVKQYPDRIINVHPSLIPSFCGKGYYGLKVHKAAIDYGVKITGATVHFVNDIPDGGKILMQKAVRVLKKDTPESLQRRVMEQAEWKMLALSTELVCKKLLANKPQ